MASNPKRTTRPQLRSLPQTRKKTSAKMAVAEGFNDIVGILILIVAGLAIWNILT